MKRIPQQEDTAEFKEQAVKRAGEVGRVARVAGESGLVEQTLRNGVKAGKLNPAGARPVTADRRELSRLRAQVARLNHAWIEKQRRSFPLPVLCEALSVSQSGFRAWQAGPPTADAGRCRARATGGTTPRPRAPSTASRTSGFMACATQPRTKARGFCSNTSPCSTTGAGATPPWDMCHQPRSCRAGSNDRITRKWQHEDDRLEGEKPRAPMPSHSGQ